MTGDAENAVGAIRAYCFRAGLGWSMTDLGTLPDSTESHGLGVNSLGQVVGWVRTTTGFTKAFYSPGSGMADISNGSRSVAHGINDAGQVVGYLHTGAVFHAFIYDRSTGQRTDLGAAPGYPHSYGLAINQSGQVAGYVSTLFQPGSFRGFLYSNGMIQLIGNANNMARALNSSGQVVGSFKDANGEDRAIFFKTTK